MLDLFKLTKELGTVLERMQAEAASWREKFPDPLPSPPVEFVQAHLPELVALLDDEQWALKLVAETWAAIQSGDAGYNKHHGGGA